MSSFVWPGVGDAGKRVSAKPAHMKLGRDDLEAAVAMHIANYNFCWRSREKDGPRAGHKRPTPAMQPGLTDRLWSFEALYNEVMA